MGSSPKHDDDEGARILAERIIAFITKTEAASSPSAALRGKPSSASTGRRP